MQRYDIYTNDDAWIHHDKDDDGDWVRYEDAAVRIASLEAQLAAMTDERDSESHWAKEYSGRVEELQAKLSDAQEVIIEHQAEIYELDKQVKAGNSDLRARLNFAKAEIGYLKTQLAAAQERERWVPCSERLPDNDGKVQIVVDAEYSDGSFYYIDGERVVDKITHWRELPSPSEAPCS